MFRFFSTLLIFTTFITEAHEPLISSRKQDIKQVLPVFGLKKPGQLLFSMIPPAYVDTDDKAEALANFIEKRYMQETNKLALFGFSPKQLNTILSKANKDTMPNLTWLNLTSNKPGIGGVITSKLLSRPFPNLRTLKYIPECKGEAMPLLKTLSILPHTLESLEILIHTNNEGKALIEALKEGKTYNIKNLKILYSDKIDKTKIETALKNGKRHSFIKTDTNLEIIKW